MPPGPPAVTLAGWVLIADAATSAVVILFNAVADTPTPMPVRAEEPPRPLVSLAYGIAAMLAWLFAVAALLRHPRWFSDGSCEVATG